MGAIFEALQCLIDPGSEVLVQDPQWVNYAAQIRLAGGVPVQGPVYEDHGFRLQDFLWPRREAHPPAGHGKGFGCAVDYQGTLRHFRECANAVELRPAVEQFTVHLVGKNQQVPRRPADAGCL